MLLGFLLIEKSYKNGAALEKYLLTQIPMKYCSASKMKTNYTLNTAKHSIQLIYEIANYQPLEIAAPLYIYCFLNNFNFDINDDSYPLDCLPFNHRLNERSFSSLSSFLFPSTTSFFSHFGS